MIKSRYKVKAPITAFLPINSPESEATYIFFIFLAILNEIIWRTQDQEAWVNFKVWGILSLTFLFTAFQIPLINKYKNE